MDNTTPNHYATLGLDRGCTAAQIRNAYRLLVKQHHPDRNPTAADALSRAQELNEAHETLSDPARRRAHDRELDERESAKRAPRGQRIERNISQDVNLRLIDFLRGTSLGVRVNDPGNRDGLETYQLTVPPNTAPGTRLRLPRASSGDVIIRVRPSPDFRFKVRGSDLRCDLRINARRAAEGGTETVAGLAGNRLPVKIPPRVARGELLRIAGEGLPKLRGGRGDLIVRVTYRPEVRVRRTGAR